MTETIAPSVNSLDNNAIEQLISSVRGYSKNVCFSCKGDKLLCSFQRCPILKRAVITLTDSVKLESEMAGPAQSIFVDWFGYPEVTLGPMIAPTTDIAVNALNPDLWYGLSIQQILALRSQVVQAQTVHDVGNYNKFIDNLQELALSIKPVDTEMRFRYKPETSISFSSVCAPTGPTAELEFMKISGNPSIPSGVENKLSSKMQSLDAIWELYNEGFDVYYLQRLLSSGVFTERRLKALMPSSWSIRTVDKHIGNRLSELIVDLPQLNDCYVYTTSYLGNHYEVLLIPGEWRFELFEAWAPNTLWTLAHARPAIYQDFEGFTVGTEHVRNSNGSYSAIRLAVLEHLAQLGRCGTAIVFREVANDYSLPLGVWHVREAVRHSFDTKNISYASVEEALAAIAIRLQTPLSEYTRHGVILRPDWTDGSLITNT